MKNSPLYDEKEIKDLASQCILCENCLEVCCTFEASREIEKSPMGRLSIVNSMLDGIKPGQEDVFNIYTCTDCGRCDTVCSADIPISEVLAQAKVIMVERSYGPLERHKEMIDSIFSKRNAVSKDYKERLNWLDEEERKKAIIDQKSSSLLYLGCMASYLDKETARASYLLLKKAEIPFTLMGDEFCCGIYPYNAGKREEAAKIFKEMYQKFQDLEISEIIVPCAGCHRTFSSYYKDLIPEFNIRVRHISEVLLDICEKNLIDFKSASQEVVFHDSCKLGRKAGIYEAPRKVLEKLGFKIKEMKENKENSPCCGAGAGVRSFAPELSMKIAKKLIDDNNQGAELISSCPFCIFNINYTAKKTKTEYRASHIAKLIYPLVN